jgi:DNA (cytosine-5)-methyltransferase 1
MSTDPTPTFIDLFAGAGGFSLGFTRAGFECVGVIENDRKASETYKANFPGHALLPLSHLGPIDGNILSLKQDDIKSALRKEGVREVDVLLAGPPCQGFSKIGRGKLDHLANRSGAFKSDPRNNLYLKFLDALKWVRPRSFLFENVTGIFRLAGMNVAETICEGAARVGYDVKCTILNSAWFGVPQSRERLFILGLRSDQKISPTFPLPIHRVVLNTGHLSEAKVLRNLFRNPDFFVRSKTPEIGPKAVSVAEAIGDLPRLFSHLNNPKYRPIRSLFPPQPYRQGRPGTYASLMRKWDNTLESMKATDHYCRWTPRDFDTFGLMQPGDKYTQAVEIAKRRYEEAKRLYTQGFLDVRPRRKAFVPPYRLGTFDEKWWKLIPSQPSWTITAHLGRDCYSHIHYDSQKRSITVREAARLQSFPDAFVFSGNMGDCFKQIGNAVPPVLAYALARHLRVLLSTSN